MSRIIHALVAITLATSLIATAEDRPLTPSVTVPTFANATCPIMGKPASMKLFVDTPKGRIYMCCIGCAKKIRLDPDRAHAAAYPSIRKAGNTVCPITGKMIPEKDAPSVILQGYEVVLCCKDCVEKAQADAQVVLVKATNPKIGDVGNKTCPITVKPVTRNTFCLIGDLVVRLSSPDCVEEVKKNPEDALAKARDIAAREEKEARAASKATEPSPVKPSGQGEGHAHDR